MRYASERNSTLIWIALKGGKARAHWNHSAFNQLNREGLTEVVSNGKVYKTHKLTSAGIEAILSLPEDLEADFYPLPSDITKAKVIVMKLK